MCHTRELAFQISKEYERFSKYMPSVKVRHFWARPGALSSVTSLAQPAFTKLGCSGCL